MFDSQVYVSLDLVLPSEDLPGSGMGLGDALWEAPQVIQVCIQTRGLCPTIRRLTLTDRKLSDGKPTRRLLGGLRRCTGRRAASCLDSAPPIGLPHPSLGADENQSTPDRSSRGAEAVLTAPLGSPEAWPGKGARARGSTMFTVGLRMKTVQALL